MVNRLALAGFTGFFAALGGQVRELYTEAERRASGDPAASAE